MNSVAEAFRTGGVWMYMLLLLLLSGAPLALVAGGISMARKRAPWAIVGGLPLLALLLGVMGASFGQMQAAEVLAHATPETRMKLMAQGVSLALNAQVFGGLVTFMLAGLGAVAVALGGAIGTGTPRKLTPIPAAVALVFGLLTAAVPLLQGGPRVLGSWAWALSGVTIVFALCAAVLYASMGEEEADVARNSAQRLGFGALAALSILGLALAAYHVGQIHVFEALEVAAPSDRHKLVKAGLDLCRDGLIAGLAATIGTLFYGVAPGLITARHALDRFGIISAAVSLALVLLTGLGSVALQQRAETTMRERGLTPGVKSVLDVAAKERRAP